MKKKEKKEWIIQYLREGKGSMKDYTNIYDKEFIDQYIINCHPNKFWFPPYGAPVVPEVGRYLSEMYHENLLNRDRVGLSNIEVGFAKWCYVYSLRK